MSKKVKITLPKKKYKLTLLKNLPEIDAGQEIVISEEEMTGKECYRGKRRFCEIYELRNSEKWVKVDEDYRCECQLYNFVKIRGEVIGYGRLVGAGIAFDEKEIQTWYYNECDSRTEVNLEIYFCPLCGRRL